MPEQTAITEKMATIKAVVTVLEEHEKELDRLLEKLDELTAQLNETEKMVERINKIDEKIDALRRDLSIVAKCLLDENNRNYFTGN
ncbi:MAG: hypothetical protein ACM3WQ_00590 [Chloroflexota bacterium]|jgi:ABC-type transporter Mla subunit MlaD|nr:hypothetical protein [Candidatus Sulfotelmatobacter sp.]